jgi:subfamily B ATP-binding cassette protein MsbA
MSDLRLLLAFAAPHRGILALSGALTLFESVVMLGVPWAGGLLTEAILRGGTGPDIGGILLAMLGLFALQSLFQFASGYLLDGTADQIIADLRTRLYDHLQALPLAFYHRRRLGDALALLSTDVYVIGAFLSSTVVALLPLLITAGGAVVMMIGIRADLAVLVVVLIPLFYLLAKISGRIMRPLSVRLQNEEAGAIAMAQENLALLAAIKTFTREPQESARYRGQIDLILRLSAQQRRLVAAFGPLAQFVAAAGVVLVIALARGDLAAGQLAPGQLVSFLLYAQLLVRPVASLADLYGHTQGVRGALVRLQQAMGEQPEPKGQIGTPLATVKGDIEFRSVSFAYEGRSLALDRLHLHISAGETVAVVGPNGAGKSTLGHLLMRLYQPAEGQVMIDGIDISTVSLESLRRQIGVVPQHVLLFNATVRDNIAFGQQQPDQAAIEAAARAARAHEFIVQLPQGYETVIGDRGVRLSGGQQQRLALARALLKDPPILILDEATAMFDPQGEAEFLHACHDTLRRRTVLLITHRPASLAAADRCVHMDSGRLLVK